MASKVTRKWDRGRFYKWNATIKDFDSLDSPFVRDLKTLPSQGHVEVTEANRHAFDLIVKDIYGDDEMYWIVQEYNRLLDVFSLEPGDKLFYPSAQNLEALLFQHSATLNVF